MTMTNRSFSLATSQRVLLACAVVCGPAALAQDAGWYLGLGTGVTQSHIDDARISNDLVAAGLSTTGIEKQENSSGYKVFAGYKFNPNFAVEGGYFDLGNFGFTSTTAPVGTLSGNLKLQGVNLDAVGILPMTPKLSLTARAGLNYANTVDSFSGTGSVHVLNPNPSSRETNMKVGVGLQYALTDALSVRVDLERYRINDAVGNRGDIDHVSVGLVYLFGISEPAPKPIAAVSVEQPAPQPAPAPAPVLVAPAPVPVAVAPVRAIAPPLRKVSFSADSLFDFDSSAIKPKGRLALDTLAAELTGVTFEAIRVTGHSDRIGAHDYNMALSLRRARAVSTYLVDSGGLPAEKFVSVGVDGKNPVTTFEQCHGLSPSSAAIACLAPDRRVEVEVTGAQ